MKKFITNSVLSLFLLSSAGIPIYAEEPSASKGSITVQLEESLNSSSSMEGVEMALVKVASPSGTGYTAEPFFESLNLDYSPTQTALQLESNAIKLYGKLIEGKYQNFWKIPSNYEDVANDMLQASNLGSATDESGNFFSDIFGGLGDMWNNLFGSPAVETSEMKEAAAGAEELDGAVEEGDSSDQAANDVVLGVDDESDQQEDSTDNSVQDQEQDADEEQTADTEQTADETKPAEKEEAANEFSEAIATWTQILEEDHLTYAFDVSNSSGRLSFTDLDYGAWLLIEINKANYDYVEPSLIYLPSASGSTNVLTSPKHSEDLKLELIKRDAASNQIIVDGAVTFTNQTTGQTYSSNMGVIEVPLQQGSNTIAESKAPNGYVLLEDKLVVEVNGIWVTVNGKGYNPYGSYDFYNYKPGDKPGNNTDTPGTNTPGTSTPGTNTPGTSTPGTSTPGTTTTTTTTTTTPGTSTSTTTPGTSTSTTGTYGTKPNTGNEQNNMIYLAIAGLGLVGLGAGGYYFYKKKKQ